jgi:small acid-soluble spore protein (thioredoxin-like protein)
MSNNNRNDNNRANNNNSGNNNRGNRPNPDDRSDNAERIQRNINFTLLNMEAADEMIEETDDERTKRNLAEKNERRREALRGMRSEMRDETKDRK